MYTAIKHLPRKPLCPACKQRYKYSLWKDVVATAPSLPLLKLLTFLTVTGSINSRIKTESFKGHFPYAENPHTSDEKYLRWYCIYPFLTNLQGLLSDIANSGKSHELPSFQKKS